MITLSLLASIDVFKSGADGYNCYRIPSMITLPGGRIFAFAEGRLHDCYDGPNHKIDIVFKSSDDSGTTWSKLGVLYSDKGDSVTINNPAPAYVGGRILVVFCRQYSSLLALRSNDALGDSSCTSAARCRRGTRCGASTRRSGGTCSRCRVKRDDSGRG